VHEISAEHLPAFCDWLGTVIAKARYKIEAVTLLDQRMHRTRHEEPDEETDGE